MENNIKLADFKDKHDITFETAISILTLNSIGKSKEEQIKNLELIDLIGFLRESTYLKDVPLADIHFNKAMEVQISKTLRRLEYFKYNSKDYIDMFNKTKLSDYEEKFKYQINSSGFEIRRLKNFVDAGILESGLLTDENKEKIVFTINEYKNHIQELKHYAFLAKLTKKDFGRDKKQNLNIDLDNAIIE